MAVVTCWTNYQIRHFKLWEVFAAVALFFALYLGQISPIGMAFIITPFIILRFRKQVEVTIPKIAIDLILGLYFLAMLLNLLPGFPDTVVLEQQIFGRAQAPFGITLNFSKPFAGLLLLAFYAKTISTFIDFRKTFLSKNGLIFCVILPLLFFTPGMLLGVQLDVKILAITPFILACNLFLTVIPEEVFFRGFLQRRIQSILGRFTLLLTPLLFTIYHGPSTYAVSIPYFIIIFIAGLLYSFVFYKSDRIEIPIAAHFMINAIHFVFLIYPY